MNPNRSSRFVPLIIACSIVAGIAIGSFYANHFAGNRLIIINTSSNKLNDLLHIIDAQYVDKVNMSDLVEKSLPKILGELDPHSTYTGAKDVEASMQDLKGSFSGIGIQFTIIDDTIRIITAINGGPSKAAGVEAGDCIVAIDGKPFVGKKVTNDEAMKRLKGPKGSKVTISVVRPGASKPLDFTIRRDDIPIKSIETAYMLDDKTGYIKVDQFADATYPESTCATTTAASSSRPYRWLMSSSPRTAWHSTCRGGILRAKTLLATGAAHTRTPRSLCSLTRKALRPARYSPAQCRTTTAPP